MKAYRRTPLLLAGAAAAAIVVAGTAVLHASAAAAGDPPVKRVEVEVTARGFVPEVVEVVAGQRVELVFTRTTASGCAASVQVPALGIERTPLPQGEAVVVAITPEKPGDYELTCGMNMFRGTIRVVAARR